MQSTHKVEVVPVLLEPHPNADTLSLVRVWGYTVCVKTEEWKDGDLGAYIVPDSIIQGYRVKVKRLRGVMSQGLLVPAPPGAHEGDDVAEILGVTRYEPPLPLSTGGEDEKPPRGIIPVYDVESWYRYRHLLVPGEEVVVTEKVHGANGRWLFDGEKMHVGSRTTWKREGMTIWWEAVRQNPWIEEVCRENQGVVFYGEVFGQVQDLKYGARKNELFVNTFDAWDLGRLLWLAVDELPEGLCMVPVLYRGPYDEAMVRGLADGPSMVYTAKHLREGCVVRPVVGRTHPECGRVLLKIVSDAYLER